MLRYAAIRLLSFIPTLFAASIVLFVTINIVPGSAADAALGITATPEARARFEREHGLDKPFPVQYTRWLEHVIHGDFGKSLQAGVPIGPDLRARLPPTLELAALAFFIANLIAVPLGSFAAYRHRQAADNASLLFMSVAGAMPNFWLATLLILLLSINLHWLPPGGYAHSARILQRTCR